MDLGVHSISTNLSNVRQDVFPMDQWTITTRKGIILQSKCTCKSTQFEANNYSKSSASYCNICAYAKALPQLHNMPDMLFKDNVLKLTHNTGVAIEFNALDALKEVEETKDPLRVAVADGWQSARADFPFAKGVTKPFDWTFTTEYRGSLISASKSTKQTNAKQKSTTSSSDSSTTETGSKANTTQPACTIRELAAALEDSKLNSNNGQVSPNKHQTSGAQQSSLEDKFEFLVEETEERIDVNKLKVREEILFYDDITLYEDELADHGTAHYSVKVRVMPKCLFILARFYLRIDGVLARINDTRIYHELNKRYLLREYTNREARLSSLNLPVSTLINPNELMTHLPIIGSRCEKLILPARTRC